MVSVLTMEEQRILYSPVCHSAHFLSLGWPQKFDQWFSPVIVCKCSSINYNLKNEGALTSLGTNCREVAPSVLARCLYNQWGDVLGDDSEQESSLDTLGHLPPELISLRRQDRGKSFLHWSLVPKDRQHKQSPEAPNPGEHLGLLMHPFASLKVVVQPKPVSGSHLGGATNPVSHQPGAFPWHCLTAGPWAACGDAPEMGQPGTPATGPSRHGMAEVGRDLQRSSCPAGSASAGRSGLSPAGFWTFAASAERWVNSPGGLPQQFLSVQSWILSLLLQLSRNERGKKSVYELWQFSAELHFYLPLPHHKAMFRKIHWYESNLDPLLFYRTSGKSHYLYLLNN